MSSPPGFVGRERELAALGLALAGGPAVVLVEGEAGIGKTRLVQEFVSSPAGQQHSCLVAACPPFREPYTLGPVVDAARQATDRVAGLRLSGLGGALRPLFPEWAAELPPAPEPLEDAKASRHRLFRALLELFDRLDVTVLVVEDVHWADEATLEFLLFLVSRQPPPLSVVVTYRPEDIPAESLLLRLSSRRSAGTTQLRLPVGPLDVRQTARLVSSMLDGEHVSATFAEFLHTRTDGIPLVVEESVRLLRDRADLARRDGEWVRRRLDDIDVPPTVRDAVLERVGRLGPAAQAVLRAAAVLAEPSDEAILAAAAELPAAEVVEGLTAVVGFGLLREDAGRLLSFRHALTCRAIYEAIPAPQRRAMHLRAGRALEGRSPLPVAGLAHHFREAGQNAEWCRYAEQAADLALAASDEATAGTMLHDLLANADLPARSVVRLITKISFAEFTGPDRYQDLVGTLRSVLATEGLEPGDEAEVRFQLGRVLSVMAEWESGRVELEKAIPHLTHDAVQAAQAMVILGRPFEATLPSASHLAWLRRATEARVAMPPGDQLLVVADLAPALLMLGEEAGWAEATVLPNDAATPLARQHVVLGQLNLGHAAMVWGRYAEAGRRLATALELADRHQYLRLRDVVLATRLHLDWFTGTWAGLGEQSGQLADDDDLQPMVRLEAVLVRGLLSAATGATADAEESFHLVLGDTLLRGSVDVAMEPAAALARLWLADGRVDDALRVTDEPYGIVATKGIWLWATDVAPVRVEALLATGRTGEAADLVTAFAGGLQGRDAPAPRAALTLCRAVLAEAGGERDRAEALYSRAAAAWQALPRPYDALLARERQAVCLLLAAERAEAGLKLLSEVFHGLAELGASAAAERVARRLREHGVDIRRDWRRGRRGYGDQLSPRELEVVRLVITGRTNREIADSLSRSPKTVAVQLNSAMRKLGVTSRTALAVSAIEAGVLNLPDGSSDKD